jgi:hypothetical protein
VSQALQRTKSDTLRIAIVLARNATVPILREVDLVGLIVVILIVEFIVVKLVEIVVILVIIVIQLILEIILQIIEIIERILRRCSRGHRRRLHTITPHVTHRQHTSIASPPHHRVTLALLPHGHRLPVRPEARNAVLRMASKPYAVRNCDHCTAAATDHPVSSRQRALLALTFLLHVTRQPLPLNRVQHLLAQANRLRSDLDQFIFFDVLERTFQRMNARRFENDRIIR